MYFSTVDDSLYLLHHVVDDVSSFKEELDLGPVILGIDVVLDGHGLVLDT